MKVALFSMFSKAQHIKMQPMATLKRQNISLSKCYFKESNKAQSLNEIKPAY